MKDRYTILAVDDNPINLKLLSRALINSDYEILTSSSGAEALKLAQIRQPDIILLDVIMPEMDGYEVCKKLQEDERTAYIPVIFLSAKNEPVDKARGLALGAVDYLTKPFNPLEINARVRTQLENRKSLIALRRQNMELVRQLNEWKNRQTHWEAKEDDHPVLFKIQPSYSMLDKEFSLMIFNLTSQNPPMTFTIPFRRKNFLLLVTLNAFERDHSARLLHSHLLHYISGFIHAAGNMEETSCRALFEHIIKDYSPDIYRVAFSFSLFNINFLQNQIVFFGLNQNPPYQKWKGQGAIFNSEPIEFHGKLKRYIHAYRGEKRKGAWFIFYQQGKGLVDGKAYRLHFFPLMERWESEQETMAEKLIGEFKEGNPDLTVYFLKLAEDQS